MDKRVISLQQRLEHGSPVEGDASPAEREAPSDRQSAMEAGADEAQRERLLRHLITHEFRERLTVVKGYLQLTRAQLGPDPGPGVLGLHQRLCRSIARLEVLADDLRELAQQREDRGAR